MHAILTLSAVAVQPTKSAAGIPVYLFQGPVPMNASITLIVAVAQPIKSVAALLVYLFQGPELTNVVLTLSVVPPLLSALVHLVYGILLVVLVVSLMVSGLKVVQLVQLVILITVMVQIFRFGVLANCDVPVLMPIRLAKRYLQCQVGVSAHWYIIVVEKVSSEGILMHSIVLRVIKRYKMNAI